MTDDMKPLTPDEGALTALSVLDYVSGLFTIAKKETFTRDEILVILNAVQNDPELFDAESRAAYAAAGERE